jgi:hypothetical protein
MEAKILEDLLNNVPQKEIRKKFKIGGKRIQQIVQKNNIQYRQSSQTNLIKDGFKKCYTCNETKPISDFPIKGAKTRHYCTKCQKTNPDIIISSILYRAKKNSQKKNREFQITKDDVLELFEKQNGRCFYTNREMEWSSGSKSNTAVSIDRIDSSKGYVKDNIALCCVVVNYIKHEMTIEEMIDWCSAIVEHSKYLH